MSKVRIALCQFALKDAQSFEAMESHLREQCEIALSKRPDIVLFPEYVTLGLLAMAGAGLTYKGLKQAVIDHVAPFTPRYEALFSELAGQSGAIIAAGSHWIMEGPEGLGFNTAHVFFPDGRIVRQKKNHLFPGETDWGTVTFDGLHVIKTPKVTVGPMTCYEAEFPETGRHLMLEGALLFLCPSATYTIRGFYRVRRCCAARAVENQVYVAECHQVGALSVPVDRPFTGYGRSAVFCPIDDQTMVDNGVLVEAESPDEEMVVVAEVNLDVLRRSRESSEATILKDRRPETYKKHYSLY